MNSSQYFQKMMANEDFWQLQPESKNDNIDRSVGKWYEMQLQKLSQDTSEDFIHDEMKTWEDLSFRVACKASKLQVSVSTIEVLFATPTTEVRRSSEIFIYIAF